MQLYFTIIETEGGIPGRPVKRPVLSSRIKGTRGLLYIYSISRCHFFLWRNQSSPTDMTVKFFLCHFRLKISWQHFESSPTGCYHILCKCPWTSKIVLQTVFHQIKTISVLPFLNKNFFSYCNNRTNLHFTGHSYIFHVRLDSGLFVCPGLIPICFCYILGHVITKFKRGKPAISFPSPF